VKSWADSRLAKVGFGNPAFDRGNVMRLAALSFAVIAFTASASLAQGVPALRQAPVGHRQPTASDLPPDVRRDEQPASATSQPAGATARSSRAPSQKQTARTRGGGPPTLQVGPSCEAAGRGAVVLGRNKEACLSDETTAQDTLKQNWSKYPGTDKTTCIGMASTGGPASYVELLSCLEILRDAKSIEAADPLAGEMETGTSRGDATHAARVRYRRADRGHRRAL
jgi:hypothetical protein